MSWGIKSVWQYGMFDPQPVIDLEKSYIAPLRHDRVLSNGDVILRTSPVLILEDVFQDFGGKFC